MSLAPEDFKETLIRCKLCQVVLIDKAEWESHIATTEHRDKAFQHRLHLQRKQNEELQRRILEETEKIQKRLLEEEEEREKEQLRRAILQKQLEIERCQQEMQTSATKTLQVDVDRHSRKRNRTGSSQEAFHFDQNDDQSDLNSSETSRPFQNYSAQLDKEIPRGLFSADSLTFGASEGGEKVNPFTQESIRDPQIQGDHMYAQELEKFVNQNSSKEDTHSAVYGQVSTFNPPSQTPEYVTSHDKWEGFSLPKKHPPTQDSQYEDTTNSVYRQFNPPSQTPEYVTSQDKWEGFSLPNKQHPPTQDSQYEDTTNSVYRQFNPPSQTPEHVASQDKWEGFSLPRKHPQIQDSQYEDTTNSVYRQFNPPSQTPEHVAYQDTWEGDSIPRKHPRVASRTPVHQPSTTPPEPDSMTSPKRFIEPMRDDSERDRKARVTSQRQTVSGIRKSASFKGFGNRDHDRSTKSFRFHHRNSSTNVSSSCVDSPTENTEQHQAIKTHQLKSKRLGMEKHKCDLASSSNQSHKEQTNDTHQSVELDVGTSAPVSVPLKRKIKLSRSWKRKSNEEANPAPKSSTKDTSPTRKHSTDTSENDLMIDIPSGSFESPNLTVPDSSQLDNEDTFDIHPETPEYDEYLDESSSLGGVFARLGKHPADDHVREFSSRTSVVIPDGMANKRRMFTVAQPLPTWKVGWRGIAFDPPSRYDYRYK